MPRQGLASLGNELYIDPESGAIYIGSDRLKLRRQLANVLKVLYAGAVESPTKWITSRDLRNGAWPKDTARKAIDESNVYPAIYSLKKFLETHALTDRMSITHEDGWGYRLQCVKRNASIEKTTVPVSVTADQRKPASPRLPASITVALKGLGLSMELNRAVRAVLTTSQFPELMRLGKEAVNNPVWRYVTDSDRSRLRSAFSPYTVPHPRLRHLDVFLIRANDSMGRPRLLHYFSDKPVSGWRAFLLPFRHRAPGEVSNVRHRKNAVDIASFFGIPRNSVRVGSLGSQYTVSVKPDPGYSELVLYIFEFCSVRISLVPRWLENLEPALPLHDSTRRFRWVHPEEMESQEGAVKVNGDLIRSVHHFFGTTLPDIPTSLSRALAKEHI